MPAITVRLSEGEAYALDVEARALGLPKSALVRAGIRAVIREPGLVLGRHAAESGTDAPPQPAKSNGKRRRRGR